MSRSVHRLARHLATLQGMSELTPKAGSACHEGKRSRPQ